MLIYCIIILVVSLITFIFYGVDKYQAIKDGWRISEKALLLLSVCGGAIGGFCAMLLFRHKTKHASFIWVNVVAIILQVALGVLIATTFPL